MKIYVGCSLTHAPESFLFDVEELKREIAKRHNVLEFLGTTAGTPKDVYQKDIKECVAGCDLMVAICDYPASGLGYEICYAVEVRGIPVLAVAHEDAQVSRLILGVQHSEYTFVRYQKLADVAMTVEDKIDSLTFDRVGVAPKKAFGAIASD